MVERNSFLGKRATVDAYMDTYLKEYALRAKKMIKTRLEEEQKMEMNQAEEDEATLEAEKHAQDHTFTFKSAASNQAKISAG